MTQREITTKGFQDRVREIAKDFIAFVNSNKEYHDTNIELMLLLNKLISNIQGATLLASYRMFNESKIILRSCFETLVLFEYVSTFPNEIEKYKDTLTSLDQFSIITKDKIIDSSEYSTIKNLIESSTVDKKVFQKS